MTGPSPGGYEKNVSMHLMDDLTKNPDKKAKGYDSELRHDFPENVRIQDNKSSSGLNATHNSDEGS